MSFAVDPRHIDHLQDEAHRRTSSVSGCAVARLRGAPLRFSRSSHASSHRTRASVLKISESRRKYQPRSDSSAFRLRNVYSWSARTAAFRSACSTSRESISSLPILFSHTGYSKEELARAGVDEGMVRLSVGLEDPEDLVADLGQALE